MSKIQESQEIHIINNEPKNSKALYEFLKRVLDGLVSFIALVVLSPLFIIVAIAIKIDSKGPIIYSQIRVGKNEKKFKMYKFRSMVSDAEGMMDELRDKNEMDGPMFKIKHDPRITSVGKFIRKTSIDELPQLINILKGEMSIVGPRPSLPDEVEQFEPWMFKRFEVKPGLTCFWQVSGRNNVGFKQWMEMDKKYVIERNFLLDIKLIFKTFKVIFTDNDGC